MLLTSNTRERSRDEEAFFSVIGNEEDKMGVAHLIREQVRYGYISKALCFLDESLHQSMIIQMGIWLPVRDIYL